MNFGLWKALSGYYGPRKAAAILAVAFGIVASPAIVVWLVMR